MKKLCDSVKTNLRDIHIVRKRDFPNQAWLDDETNGRIRQAGISPCTKNRVCEKESLIPSRMLLFQSEGEGGGVPHPKVLISL